MPDPKILKVGDLVRFIELPDEWSRSNYFVHRDCRAFMKKLIRRNWPSRVYKLDENGLPWIRAVTFERGRRNYHSWAIFESTGWRVVERRS